jgi:phage baseplate assembly protein gpV
MSLETRILHLERQVAELHVALKNLFRVMTVEEFDPEADRFIATERIEGDDSAEEPQTSKIRMMQQTGAIKSRDTLSQGEQVLVISPTGHLDDAAFGLPFGPNDENESPSSATVESLKQIGDTVARLTEGGAQLLGNRVDLGASGGKKVVLDGDFVEITTGSSAGKWPVKSSANHTFAK